MGFAEDSVIMESRIGSVSSGLGFSPSVKGRASKCSPFCPPSTSKLTQSIIKDHMMSHYKKVYSAKAAIDTSVPKSLIHSVKYNDQIRQERLRTGRRPQSAHSLSQRNTQASCSSAQSRLSVQYDDSPFLYSRSSMISSPKFTSFHAKETVYPSHKVSSQSHSHHTRPASEMKYRTSETVLQRNPSTWSLGASGFQNCYKTFQDPGQKTYSGDLLQKHSQHFTQEQPFTPKTLKSEKPSYLSKYRYYRAPLRKPQDCTNSRLTLQETYHGSTETRKCLQECDEPTQELNTELECSENELNGTYVSASRQDTRTNKSRNNYYFDSSSREEELMYLEFISAVTEDILSRGHISDRVLDRVINRHIDMNRGRLDEGKMRHLLEALRKDFEEPFDTSTSNTELEKKENDLLDALLPHQESRGRQVKTKEDNDLLPYASLIEHCDTPDHTDFLPGLTAPCSPESTASPVKTKENDEEGEPEEKRVDSTLLSEHITNNSGITEEDVHQNETGANATGNEITSESHKLTTVISGEVIYDGQVKELEDLEKTFSESLHILEPANERHTDVAASVSDDDF
ncbi:spermatogenesis-associated protein 7 homolog isoform X2 [Betta splendens]|uniref:Spermatogenesis-associated protein 7 homolog isoform X2 n=1 Tax=Betta splendens TaxID=158456 RepID=A0A6P7LJ03_BETSP|nr:spermatogenesis-associated protein 7 homolog isoform X2 [Betta splendens]